MLPDPLHPAIVHFPVALAIIFPLMAALALIFIKRGSSAINTWIPIAVLAVMVFAGTLVAKNTGGAEEDKVEEVVSRGAIHDHEENAELFAILAGITLAISLGGFLPNKWGNMARYLTVVASLAVVFVAYQTGKSGGELVYEHGAGSAYASPSSGNEAVSTESDSTSTSATSDDDDDDDKD
jgi:uncharacterized membrane protein